MKVQKALLLLLSIGLTHAAPVPAHYSETTKGVAAQQTRAVDKRTTFLFWNEAAKALAGLGSIGVLLYIAKGKYDKLIQEVPVNQRLQARFVDALLHPEDTGSEKDDQAIRVVILGQPNSLSALKEGESLERRMSPETVKDFIVSFKTIQAMSAVRSYYNLGAEGAKALLAMAALALTLYSADTKFEKLSAAENARLAQQGHHLIMSPVSRHEEKRIPNEKTTNFQRGGLKPQSFSGLKAIELDLDATARAEFSAAFKAVQIVCTATGLPIAYWNVHHRRQE
ncbi:hypothetical protein OC861_001868 [Tilletia horrida]|nr:hypothetical protein OC861_001868 [Tilletia horrida]